MRKICSCVLFASLFTCLLSSTRADQPAAYHIPYLQDIVIDGKSDDWKENGFRVDLMMPVEGELRKADDHDARVRLAWNEDGLLLLVYIQDKNWIENPSKTELWQNDSIEVFLAPKKGSPDLCQWVIAPGMDPKQPSLRWNFHDCRKQEALKKLPAEISAERVRQGSACAVEVLIPWKSLDISPEEGKEIAFQIWVNNVDTPNEPCKYRVAWYPTLSPHNDTTRMQCLKLAKEASPSICASSRGEYDFDVLKTVVTIFADSGSKGKTVSIAEDGRLLGQALMDENPAGRFSARIKLPLPPAGKTYGPLTIAIADKTVDTLVLPDLSRKRAEALLWESPSARPSVFSGSTLPDVKFEHPLRVEALTGPYEIKTTYYDKDYNVVTTADKNGRYGAVVRIIPENGRPFCRFKTLFRHPEKLHWWRYEMDASISLPAGLGVKPEALASYPRTVSEFVKWQIVDRFDNKDDAAVLFSGLFESGANSVKDDFYSDPWRRNNQWWVGLKRRLYGWDKLYPQAFICPKPTEGSPAAVVRAGAAEEAGMKPDAAAQIDAVLSEWSKDTDEAFAVCVARHGVIVLHKAYGVRDGKPMTSETKSWMASITKMLSGTCMMMLVDQGLIDLDDPVDKYLPPLRGLRKDTPLTIRHLYTHTNGMDWHWGGEEGDMEERIASLLPFYEVGKRYAYNGTGLELGCKILEAVTGESLPMFYKKHLLDPLGCGNTDIDNASSGARSVPLDMAKIGQMLLNKGAYGDMRFMREETFKKMLPQKLTMVLGPDTTQVYGIGTSFFNDKGLGEGTFAHGAASSATLRIDPVNDLVIVMTRNSSGKNFGKYHQRFIDAVVAGMKQ